MVNITALEQLHRYIIEKNLTPMKNWDNRYKKSAGGTPSSYFRKMIKQIRTILNILSGENPVQMLKGKY
jgi:hypothetical protein